MSHLPWARPTISTADVDAVAQAVRETALGRGPATTRFESALAQYLAVEHVVAFASGTAALHAAYAAAGVARGKSILTSPITSIATANAALYLGGSVRFADVHPRTGVIDPDAADDAAADDVAVLVPVHYGGEVPPMDVIAAIAEARRWLVIEDASLALGARYQTSDGSEHQVGGCDHSAMCCFGFRAEAPITTGEGGAVTTNDTALATRLRRFRDQGIGPASDQVPDVAEPWYSEQRDLGFDYSITDYQGALGESQLRQLPGWLNRRREIVERYRAALADHPAITLLTSPLGSHGANTLFVVQVPEQYRRQIFDAMRSAGIGVEVHYLPVHRQPFHHDLQGELYLPGAERFSASVITLPLYPSLTDQEADRVVEALLAAVGRIALH